MTAPSTVAILGAGSWGTSVAIHIANAGHSVRLWGHRADAITAMKETRENQRYLPGIAFPPSLVPVTTIDEAIDSVEQIIIAVPSHAFLSVIQQLKPPKSGVAWITKGIAPTSNQFFSAIIASVWGENMPTAIISGPSFAKEVAIGLPTALTIASQFPDFLKRLQRLFHHHHMRTYLTPDIIGVELAGTVKNVLAIACGISDGLGFGANAKAALITRGLSEMTKLGLKLGASQETFMGLAGVGDLVLTCTDNQSRNRRFGLLLGQGQSIDNAEKSINQVIEGKHNAAQVVALAKAHHVEMPICQAVHALLTGKMKPKEAVTNLMNRPPRYEH